MVKGKGCHRKYGVCHCTVLTLELMFITAYAHIASPCLQLC